LVQGWLYQDQLRLVAQLDGNSNVVARFVYGSKPNVPDYMVTSGATYRILSDHLGSPRAVVDIASGNLIETISFDEFGNEADTLAGTLPTGYVRIPFGFAGGLYDPDTTLVRFGARDYDATTGRWTAKDPARFGGGMNLYGYVVDDPINMADPAGRGPACNFAGAYCQETGDSCACVCTAAKICTQGGRLWLLGKVYSKLTSHMRRRPEHRRSGLRGAGTGRICEVHPEMHRPTP
jgi:RHS repeat-associated protein